MVGASSQGPLANAELLTETTTSTTTEKPKEIIPILKDERDGPLHGDFRFHFQTGDGIDRVEEGDPHGIRSGVIK